MAGKMTTNATGTNNAGAGLISQARAYSEGMFYRAAGTLVGQPKANNPYPVGSPDHDSWDAGWDLAEANKGGSISRADLGSCADPGAISL